MLHLIASRLLQLPLILAVVFAVTFSLVWVMPGSPLDRKGERQLAPEVLRAMEARYNLDSRTSFVTGYLGGLAKGDFGPSLQYRGRTVAEILGQGLPVSMSLGVAALAVAVFCWAPLPAWRERCVPAACSTAAVWRSRSSVSACRVL